MWVSLKTSSCIWAKLSLKLLFYVSFLSMPGQSEMHCSAIANTTINYITNPCSITYFEVAEVAKLHHFLVAARPYQHSLIFNCKFPISWLPVATFWEILLPSLGNDGRRISKLSLISMLAHDVINVLYYCKISIWTCCVASISCRCPTFLIFFFYNGQLLIKWLSLLATFFKLHLNKMVTLLVSTSAAGSGVDVSVLEN